MSEVGTPEYGDDMTPRVNGTNYRTGAPCEWITQRNTSSGHWLHICEYDDYAYLGLGDYETGGWIYADADALEALGALLTNMAARLRANGGDK